MVKINNFILNTNPQWGGGESHCYLAIKLLRVYYIWHSYMNILMLVNRMERACTKSEQIHIMHDIYSARAATKRCTTFVLYNSIQCVSNRKHKSLRGIYLYIIHYVLASPYYINISLCIAHKCLKILLIVCFCGLLLYT